MMLHKNGSVLQYLKVMRKFPTDYVPTWKDWDHSFLLRFSTNELKGVADHFSQLQPFKPDSKLFVLDQ